MNIARIIARMLLGLLFTAAGIMAFVITTPPPEPGLAGAFNEIFMKSHWALFVGSAQLALGVLLLVNRFVPVALIVLAAFLYNSFAFHLTMAPSVLFAPILCTALGAFVAWPYRALFAPLFAATPITDRSETASRSVRAA